MNVLLLPFRARTWREGLYSLLNLPVALAGFVFAAAGLATSAGLLITFVGLPLMALVLLVLRMFGRLERARARLLLRLEVAEPERLRLTEGRSGPLAWMGAVLRSNVSWRSAAYALLHMPWAVFTFGAVTALWSAGWSMLTFPLWFWTIPAFTDEPGVGVNTGGDPDEAWIWDGPFEVVMAVVLGLLLLLVAAWLIRGMAAVDRLLVSSLLGPSAAAARMWQLESDRSVVVDTSAADLRRIERDLHDGAQARLVALAMDLGLAKEKLTEDPQAAARMVDEAHGEVKLALQELRDLARGIHPAILTDRGLGPALSNVAARCTVPVTVDVELPFRPAEAIEGIAYFTVCELLQNVSKHSGARHAQVDVWRADDRLMLQVTDDGHGGADLTAGSGLAGLAERLAAVDGLLALDSPAGGPTTISAALPWRDRTASHAPAR
ncbi:sensor histidine kinase [Streptomyces litchfieldiae]|uniref:histidine kinase n=1 Tax=Streptomyces litchfieldiae TaxID=3075543 RepID=A0ABU2MYJ5_9ACTN|nr:sensor domain-containing protein [Streptomyces sp. DSM 44938]MDT0346721.1 sensor domain-containing protein [Streptomyces sp. DSM 44938]